MGRDLLIDGYNLMHAAGLARARYGPGDLERCRCALLRLIAGQLSDQQRQGTTVVFDGKDSPAGADRLDSYADILVMYSEPEEEADDLIERLIAAHSAPRRLTVVSSDHRLHKAARRRRARPLDSDEFLDECARHVYRARSQQKHEPDEKPGVESPEEIDRLLTVFDIDVQVELLKVPEPVMRPPDVVPAAAPPCPAPPAKDAELPFDELAFWEARIAELFRRNPSEFVDI